MDDGERDGDARTFRANFSGEGAAMLRERVKEKLKEFMGDYTDDTLVEYVIVLLKNGRRKDEAMKELNVFLGDDSVSFISWLWDHLSSNLHVYVQPKESIPEKATKAKPTLDVLSGKRSQEENAAGNKLADSENEREKLNKESRSRRNREWKGLVQEISSVPIQKSFTGSTQHGGKNHQRKTIGRRSRSPRLHSNRKRIRQEEELSAKQRESASVPVIDAPRRLLQFAVRDAVKPIQRPSSRTEPAIKRLRSVVSTSNTDSVLDERPQRKRSVGRVAGPVATALKAAAEAAEDVSKVRHSGSVFDRLDRSASTKRIINRTSDLEEHVPEVEYDDYDQIPGSNYSDFQGRHEYFGEFNGDTAMLDRDNEVATDSASDDDGYDSLGVSRSRDFDFSQSVSSASRDNKSLMVQYSVAQDVDEVLRKTKPAIEDLPTSAASKGTSKIVNISVNVNTWKPPHYKECRDATIGANQMAVDRSEASAAKPSAQVLKENITAKTENENEKTQKDTLKEPQKVAGSVPGSYTSGRPEDVDSRTVFVSNVHFAATKDTLSRHFNKFGEVLKVIILTDAATSQPTGSAYVEFLRKESAELALSLNGTSFMSRILKVVRRSSAHPEAAAMIGWPRSARGSPYASRLSRGIPYARGVIPSVFRGRLPLKSGARSLQWRRETSAQKGSQTASAPAGNTVLSPTGRNLTYVRPDTKTDASSAAV
ncbi:Nuclear polyadenylated RNA binding protein [Dioscorea alata]|uniref:Nuclear polyadenylated RNA binding protein n=1 Tax=Dioscorea alata TaxID=55571 RepID=A0ACB7W386_DIOAL|nr:Nuclear polyadenylated RNA binding protein [Dioscorea alata]